RPVLVLNWNAEALAQLLDRLGEVELLGLAHKRDGVPGLSAAEALVEPLFGVDVEGGGFLAVERAKALQPRAARLSQGHDARDDVGKVYPQLQVADAGGFGDG